MFLVRAPFGEVCPVIAGLPVQTLSFSIVVFLGKALNFFFLVLPNVRLLQGSYGYNVALRKKLLAGFVESVEVLNFALLTFTHDLRNVPVL